MKTLQLSDTKTYNRPMAFVIYAYIEVPTYSTGKDGSPDWVYERTHCRRVRVASYATKLLAEWWAINLKRVWLDATTKLQIVPMEQVKMLEIVEEP